MQAFILLILIVSGLLAAVAALTFFAEPADGHDNTLPLLYFFA